MTKKFFIIAGEASGDLLGSKLIKELKLQEPDATFIGVGGKLMQEQGLSSIFPMEELSVMGFFEVVPHLFKLLARIDQTAKAVIEANPDFVITIDSPDFCFRVIKKLPQIFFAKKIHLIAPSVWAYRPGRAEKISKLYDLLLAILPFEPPYFEKHGLKTVFIGNPVIENAPDFSKKSEINLAFRAKYDIAANDLVISVTPGSRVAEVKQIFPEFIKALNSLSPKFPNLKVVIPLVDKTRNLVSQMAQQLKMQYSLIESEDKKSMLFAVDFALAKSGTNTLEFSLYQVPMLIAYKVNSLTYFVAQMLMKVKFANLVNLILNEEIIPEMIQENCRSELIAEKLEILFSDKKLRQKQIDKTVAALKIMGLGEEESSSKKAAREILSLSK
jgi:lipid-A-disaccharide synthase